MKKNTLSTIILVSLFFLWFSLPPFSVRIPPMNKSTTIKPKTIRVPFLKKEINVSLPIRLGLDLQGGSRLVFLLDTANINKENIPDAVSAARDIIERRINFFGVNEPQLSLLKGGNVYKIAVELPGVKDPTKTAKTIGQTAQLGFSTYKEEVVKQGTQSATIPTFLPTKLTGAYLKKASLVFDQKSGSPQVGIQFNKEGARLFAEITKNNKKKPLAIFLDNQLLTAPVVQDEIKDGNAVISGSFKVEEAKTLVNQLNAGALPVPVRLLEQKTIEPTLGKENVQKSLIAGVVGLLSVVVFMLVLYGKNGILATISLFLYALYSVFIFQISGIVMTLSGVAGFLLSIGMAVDSNILIYERIKEEKIRTKDVALATKLGFNNALKAIKQANTNTLLIAGVLFNPFNLSFLPISGSVRGFSLTLAIGVVLSLLTGVFVVKNILWHVYKIDKE
ncbi:protein translocase subunit SecD [Candidatus Roizmanbacteria bacterium CG10_big_fil_rev_8_21_14_0_10_39_6]|uniref:Protein translocase subunit SecD n=1 Tax=Candidatus Roizmanbacteria bacterium CG10_big_fil_rev_8_21_14_0_10_39_6 TaxID=1974853 RepID=A0A2M8KT47_9BACT|nr:MAG: protein translocase subunit SecD [Candidatus Roizmanbacteria bacterium CG10_big_fil_rev_8_21_14_0_10_39_6]